MHNQSEMCIRDRTWEDPIDVIDLKSQSYFSGTQSAYTIDPAMIAEDENGKNPGRVWMLVDMFPESTNGSQGTWSIKETGTGSVSYTHLGRVFPQFRDKSFD